MISKKTATKKPEVKKEVKAEPVEVKAEPKKEPVKKEAKYICTELCYHNGTLYKKGDILIGEPPKTKEGKPSHFEEIE